MDWWWEWSKCALVEGCVVIYHPNCVERTFMEISLVLDGRFFRSLFLEMRIEGSIHCLDFVFLLLSPLAFLTSKTFS